jgi:molecular chaperone HtpG
MSNQLQKVLSHTMKEYEAPKRIMEVNPHAGLIQRLCELSNNSDNDEFIRDCGQQLYANSLILDGLIPEVEGTTSRTLRFMEELARGKSVIIT